MRSRLWSVFLSLFFVNLIFSSLVYANDAGWSPCDNIRVAPPLGAPYFLKVQILRVDDLGDIDEDIIWTRRADYYPILTIDGITHGGPEYEISKDDHPQPTDDFWTFIQPITIIGGIEEEIPITIDMWEADPWGDNHADVSPDSGTKTLTFTVNSCSQKINPPGFFINLNPTVAMDLESEGTGGEAAHLKFRVEWVTALPGAEFPDGAAGSPTVGDVLIKEADFIQVIPNATLVEGKTGIFKIKVQNTFSISTAPDLWLKLTGPNGLNIEVTDSIDPPLLAMETRTLYCGAASCETLTTSFDIPADDEDLPAPITLPYTGAPYYASLQVIMDSNCEYRPSDCAPCPLGCGSCPPCDSCRLENDSISTKLKVVPTQILRTVYAPVTSPILPDDAPSPDTVVTTLDMTSSFVRATWPLRKFDPGLWSLYEPLIIESATWDPVIDLILALLGLIFGDAYNCIDPFITQASLSAVATIEGYDKIVGVVVPDWFDQHASELCQGWENVTGLSSIEMAPHGVLIIPDSLTLAAHELGHTYALSVDPSLKQDESLSTLPLFAAGSWDEYNAERDDPLEEMKARKGNPSHGLWLNQGVIEPGSVTPLLQKQQCDSHCFMGSGNSNEHLYWDTRKHWIDGDDYEQLVRKLEANAGGATVQSEIIHVTGVMGDKRPDPPAGRHVVEVPRDWDVVAFAPWYKLQNRAVDLELGSIGHYAFVYFDATGKKLAEAAFSPPNAIPDYNEITPFTLFSLNIPLPAGTKRIEVVNRINGKSLGGRTFSTNNPVVQFINPMGQIDIPQGEIVTITWTGSDLDGDSLVYNLMGSFDGGLSWEPIRMGTDATSASLPTAEIPVRSQITLKLLATDGVNTSEVLGGPIIIIPGVVTAQAYLVEQDPQNGLLTAVNLSGGTKTPVASGLAGPFDIVLNSAGTTAYVTEGNSTKVSSVDIESGVVQTITSSVSSPYGIALDNNGGTAYVTELYNGRLVTVEISTGTVTEVVSGLSAPKEVELDPSGAFVYVVEAGSDELSKVDIARKTITVVTSGIPSPRGLAINADGTTAYVTDGTSGGNLWAVDTVSGAKTVVATGLVYPEGVTLNAAETTAYVTSGYTGQLMSVDIASGTVTTIASGLMAPRGVDVRE